MRKQSKRSSITQNFTWRNSWGVFFILPSLVGVAVFHIIPFISVVQHSFMVPYGKEMVGFKNYGIVMQNESFQKAAANTGKFLIFCIPILMLFSLVLVFFVRSAKRMKFLKSAALLPLAVPVATMALIWRLLFDENGVLGNVLSGMGKSKIDFFHTSAAFGVLVFTYVWRNFGYDMVLWGSALGSIDEQLYEAASIDGADRRQKFFYITLPNLMSFVAVITILSVLNAFKVFREAYLIAGDYPHDSIYMLQHIFNNWFTNLEMGKMCAGAVILTGVIGTGALLLQKMWKEE